MAKKGEKLRPKPRPIVNCGRCKNQHYSGNEKYCCGYGNK